MDPGGGGALPSPKCFLRRAARRFFLVTVLIYVPMMKETRLKKGTQVLSGRNFCAKAKQMGEVIQLTRITFQKLTLRVART